MVDRLKSARRLQKGRPNPSFPDLIAQTPAARSLVDAIARTARCLFISVSREVSIGSRRETASEPPIQGSGKGSKLSHRESPR